MEPSSISVINQIAESQAVWAILFITLAYYFLRQSEKRELALKEEARILAEKSFEREQAMISELNNISKTLMDVSFSMKEISEGQKSLGGRVDRMEKYIYKGANCDEKH